MNRLYRLGALVLSATVLFSALSGCSSTETTEETTTETTTETTEAATGDVYDLDAITDLYLELCGVAEDTVVATVDGVDITAGEYLYAVTYVCDQVAYMYQYYYGVAELPWDEDYTDGVTWKEYLAESSLSTAGLYAIIPQQAEALGASLSQDMIDEVYAEIEAAKLDIPEGLNSDIIFWQLGASANVYENMATVMYLYDALVEVYLETGIDGYPTDDEVVAYADAAEEAMGAYSAKHILFMTMDSATYAALSEEEAAAKLELAEDVLAQLNAVSGEEQIALFDTLMNEYSEDGRDATTGDLYYPDGYETYAGEMVAEFEAAAMELDDYGISGIVETTYGYHIIMRLPMDTEVDYEAYREEMIVNAVYEMQTAWMEEYVPVTTEAFADVDIQLFYENLDVLYEQMSAAVTAASAS